MRKIQPQPTITDSSAPEEDQYEQQQWIDYEEDLHDEYREPMQVKMRNQDGFLDFRIFVRLLILELKLIIYPTVPPASEMNFDR